MATRPESPIVEENVGIATWRLDTPDPNGDPLELMIKCEEEDLRSQKEPGSTYHEYLETHRNTH
jgi:hypothetical protein